MTTSYESTQSISLDLSDSEHSYPAPSSTHSKKARARASSFGSGRIYDPEREQAGSDSSPQSQSRPHSRQSTISLGAWGLESPGPMPDSEAAPHAEPHGHLHGTSPRFVGHATRRSSELSILDNPYGAGEPEGSGSPGPFAGLLPSVQAQRKGLLAEAERQGGREEVLLDDEGSAVGYAGQANGNGNVNGHGPKPRTPLIGLEPPTPIDARPQHARPASTQSYNSPGRPSSGVRERNVSPTYSATDPPNPYGSSGTTLMGTPVMGQNEQPDEGEGSPAADGKKEPSIRPAPSPSGSRNVSGASDSLSLHSNGYQPGVGQTAVDPSRTHAQQRARPYINPGTPGLGLGAGSYVYAPNGFPLSSPAMTPSTEKTALMLGSGLEGGRSVSPGPLGSPGQPGHASFWDSPAWWLIMYFCFNLGLTLFNKVVLVSFPFPYTLTGLHALSGCAGCYVALERGAFTPARLTSKENLILAAFSVLYTINIAVSNISLQLVTVPFHQVVRASTPLFTIMIATLVLRQKFSLMKLVSLLPVVAGVGFATYGDYYFTAWGLILTLLGTFLAALKTVVTNLIQTGGGGRLKLHPLDLLMRMSPLAFIQCVIYGLYTGELERVRRYGATQMTQGKAIALLVNGVIACGLNIVSFTANKKAGALTMTVSANCKQVLTIALAVVLFDLHINILNGIGICLTLIGGGWYGWVEFTEKSRKARKAAT